MARVTVADLMLLKQQRKKIIAMTAYDFEMARIVERAGADAILVGDTGARFALGSDDVEATMDEMILLARSVSRAAKRVMVVADMPFMSYQVSFEQAIANAGRFLKEAKADAIKVEGGEDFAPTVRAIVKMGIPVMGHVGLTVQTALAYGGNYNDKNASVTNEQIRRDALAMQAAGCFAVVLTKVPADYARELTAELTIPTLAGGGAGDDCDGQVCVIHSALGLSASAIDAPSTGYGPLSKTIYDTMKQFCDDVRSGKPVRTVREKTPA